jgi:hypothetical protein
MAAAESLPRKTLVDGEIVIAEAVATRPASLLVFDVFELAGDELTALPLSQRRPVLERLLVPGHPCLCCRSRRRGRSASIGPTWQGAGEIGSMSSVSGPSLTLPGVDGITATGPAMHLFGRRHGRIHREGERLSTNCRRR